MEKIETESRTVSRILRDTLPNIFDDMCLFSLGKSEYVERGEKPEKRRY